MKTEQFPEQKEQSKEESQQQACGCQAGALCPRCKQGILDYNGLLNIQCPICGLEIGHTHT